MLRPSALVVLTVFTLEAPSLAQEPLFLPAASSPIQVGEGSGTILLQDVNRDRRLDLLTRHLLPRRIEVLRGDGRGNFTPFGPSLEFAYEPGDMKLGDINRDRVPDLVVTSNNRDFVDVLLGDGRGGFRPAQGSPFTVSRVIDTYNKRTLHLVDLNNDGNLDVATANGRLRNTVRTLLGNGRAGFTPGPIVTLDTRGDGFALAFGDMNGDRKVDVVSASKASEQSGRLAVQLGDGRGAFRAVAGSAMRIPAEPSAVALRDMNGDDRMDIVVGHSSGRVSLFLNQGDGAFVQAPGSPIEVGSPLYALLLVDANSDSLPDLVIPTVKHVTVLLAGGGGFGPAPGSPFPAGPGAYNIGAGDVNGDGKVDLVASSFEGMGVTLLLRQ